MLSAMKNEWVVIKKELAIFFDTHAWGWIALGLFVSSPFVARQVGDYRWWYVGACVVILLATMLYQERGGRMRPWEREYFYSLHKQGNGAPVPPEVENPYSDIEEEMEYFFELQRAAMKGDSDGKNNT
jgi:hypothetical protein